MGVGAAGGITGHESGDGGCDEGGESSMSGNGALMGSSAGS